MEVVRKNSGCTGCMACVVACQDRNRLKPEVLLCAVESGESGRPQWKGCRQCEEPACMDACPFGAISRRSGDGVVAIDRALCRGCRLCVKACPYLVMAFDGEQRIAKKCELCGGASPACVGACPYHILELE